MILQALNNWIISPLIAIIFEDLELDWKFLENIRTIRNKNKYQGLDISKEMWKSAEMQLDPYISTIRKEIEEKLTS